MAGLLGKSDLQMLKGWIAPEKSGGGLRKEKTKPGTGWGQSQK